jgi:hypothetical protein
VSLRFWITPQRNQLNSNHSAVRRSGAIFQLRFAGLARAVDAAEAPSASTPCPTIRQLQCAQTGASAWMAHSKLSKVWRCPPTTTSNALSYSFSQTSHVAIHKCFRAPDALRRVCFIPEGEKLHPATFAVCCRCAAGAVGRCRGSSHGAGK